MEINYKRLAIMALNLIRKNSISSLPNSTQGRYDLSLHFNLLQYDRNKMLLKHIFKTQGRCATAIKLRKKAFSPTSRGLSAGLSLPTSRTTQYSTGLYDFNRYI